MNDASILQTADKHKTLFSCELFYAKCTFALFTRNMSLISVNIVKALAASYKSRQVVPGNDKG